MISKISIYKPLPKKFNIELNPKNIECYFNYKKYVNFKKLCENLLSVSDDKLYKALDMFAKNHYKYRDTLYYNLQNITVEDVYSDDLDGYYLLTKNDNVMAYISISDCYHELLHVASTIMDRSNENLYSGFGIVGNKSWLNFGEGLTDGYIELLVTRDLYDDKEITCYDEESSSFKLPEYFYSKALARQLEIIIGKEKLKDMFFKKGFNRLKQELMKYKSEEEVMMFLKNCDAAALAGLYKNPLLNMKVLKAQDFLVEICKEFMPEKLKLFCKEKIMKTNTLETELTTVRLEDEITERKNNKKSR